MDSPWKRFWETGLFPFLEISLGLSLGYTLSFLFFVASNELRLVDTSDTSFPVLQAVLLVFFGFGFLLRKYVPKAPKTLLLFLFSGNTLLLVWVYLYASSEFLIDYIFSFQFILLSSALTSFNTGMYCGSIKDFRSLSFALGITLFTFYSLFDIGIIVPLNTLIVVLLFLLEVYLSSIFFKQPSFSIRFYKIRSKIGNHPFFTPFYRSALSMLIAYLGLHLYFQPGPKIPVILSISFALFMGRILSLVNGIRRETKAIYLIGRILLLTGFFFFIYQSYWNYFYIALCIILAGLVGFFKPNNTKVSEYAFVALEAVAYFGLSLLLYHWNLPISLRTLLALLFVPIVSYQFFRTRSTVKIPKYAFVGISGLSVLFFFYPPSIRSTTPFSKKEIYEPIPFKISNIEIAKKDYIFYRTILPQESKSFLPKESEIEDKVVILGLVENTTQMISYIEKLRKENHKFIIFVSRKKNQTSTATNALSLLKRQSFWGYDIYFPAYMERPFQFSDLIPKDWRFKYFQDKLENADTNEIRLQLENTIRYSSGDLRKDALTIKRLYYESYAEYAKYYFRIGQNKLALDAIILARKFENPDIELLRIAYNSLKFTSPEPEFIPILEDLSLQNEFKEFAWNTLIPMFESIGDWKNALFTMESLERYYRDKNEISLAKELELVRVRLYLNQENWKDAEPLINQRAKENPDSVIWERLKNEVLEKKESAKRVYQRPEAREARIQ
ncbi:putative membrane protein [Leptospira ryugenii]|uniref:Putative membrane protein n=2 Tax=Leptospira ryugenii TaxID=1917863 RepID=A0A2P2E4J2_9LEPT|nr:putative membrane protein [Leptospira ryugenii]